MNTRSARPVLLGLLLFVLALGSAPHARATPMGVGHALPTAKFELGSLVPKVTFKAAAKLKGGKAKLSLKAAIRFAGKTLNVPIFDMGVKKSKKSITVKRKVGKLSVSLKVSWSGTRTIVIKGTAKYLKFKVPVPKIKVRI